MDQIVSSLSTYDLAGLRAIWNQLDTKLFCRLEQQYMPGTCFGSSSRQVDTLARLISKPWHLFILPFQIFGYEIIVLLPYKTCLLWLVTHTLKYFHLYGNGQLIVMILFLSSSFSLSAVRKFEASLLKRYVINAVQNNKRDKVLEFFEKMTPEIQGQSEWRDWFGKYTNALIFRFMIAFFFLYPKIWLMPNWVVSAQRCRL